MGRTDDIPLVSVDTATFKAIEFLVAKNLVSISSGRIHVTDNGADLYSVLIDNDIMRDEISFLINFGKRLTEDKVNGLTGKDKLC